MSDLAYLYALGEARSCLAALADAATTDDEASYFEWLLIHLDLVTDDVGPTTLANPGRPGRTACSSRCRRDTRARSRDRPRAVIDQT